MAILKLSDLLLLSTEQMLVCLDDTHDTFIVTDDVLTIPDIEPIGGDVIFQIGCISEA